VISSATTPWPVTATVGSTRLPQRPGVEKHGLPQLLCHPGCLYRVSRVHHDRPVPAHRWPGSEWHAIAPGCPRHCRNGIGRLPVRVLRQVASGLRFSTSAWVHRLGEPRELPAAMRHDPATMRNTSSPRDLNRIFCGKIWLDSPPSSGAVCPSHSRRHRTLVTGPPGLSKKMRNSHLCST
jgi:hypothetical protein